MRIDSTGLTPTSLTEYIEQLNTAFRDALGANLSVSPQSPQGQLVGVDALARARTDEVAVAVASGMNLYTATGAQLDSLCSVLQIPRAPATRSTVTVTLTGNPGTVIPASSHARTSEGAVFELSSETTISASGSTDAPMAAIESGPVVAVAGTLNSIVEPVTGWTGVTNAEDAVLGSVIETDSDYRARYLRSLAVAGRGSLETIEANILATEGVTDVLVRDNPTASTATIQGVSVAAGALVCVVKGGTDSDVGKAIAKTRPGGTPTVGTTSVVVTHPDGSSETIRFYRVSSIPLKVVVTTTIEGGFGGGGVVQIRQRVVDWFAGRWFSGAGDFDTLGVGIGEELSVSALYGPVYSVPGHSVTGLVVTRKNGSAVPSSVNLDQQLTLDLADITVNTS